LKKTHEQVWKKGEKIKKEDRVHQRFSVTFFPLALVFFYYAARKSSDSKKQILSNQV